MYFNDEVLEDIRQGNDIVEVIREYLPLEARGNDHFGICPFHRENTPSFSVSEEKQFYYCFGCGASGNVFGFVMAMENQSFVDAVEILANRIHYEIPKSEKSQQGHDEKEKMRRVYVEAAKFFHTELMGKDGGIPRSYLMNRGIKSDLSSVFGLGYTGRDFFGLSNHLKKKYAEDFLIQAGLSVKTKKGALMDRFRNRLIFPIFDRQGRVIAFGGRSLGEDMPKYLNSPDTKIFNKQQVLYGLHFARASKRKDILVVEGYLDVMKLFQGGFEHVVATLGTAVSLQHAREIKRYFTDVTLLFDGDEAGEKAALRAITHFLKVDIEPKILRLPKKMDPDDFISEKGAKGLQIFIDEQSMNYILFQVALIAETKNLDTFNDTLMFQKEVASLVGALQSPVERHNYGAEIAKIYALDEHALKEEIHMVATKTPETYEHIQSEKRKTIKFSGQAMEKEEKMVDETRRLLIFYGSKSTEYADVLAAYLVASDFGNGVYEKLYKKIISLMKTDGHVELASLLSSFETVSEQEAVSGIFAFSLEVADRKTERALISSQIKRLLIFKVQKDIEKAGSQGDIKRMDELQKKIREIQTKQIFKNI